MAEHLVRPRQELERWDRIQGAELTNHVDSIDSTGSADPVIIDDARHESSDPEPQDRAFMARVITIFLTVPSSSNLEPQHDALIREIENDTRVIDLVHDGFDAEWSTRRSIFPIRAKADDMLTDIDVQSAFLLRSPLYFTVRVPLKNQPKFKGHDDFPSDTYHVMWNGLTAVVVWESEQSAEIPRAGGHIAIDVMKDAARKAGLDAVPQGCNPGCDFLFMHDTLTVIRDADYPYAQLDATDRSRMIIRTCGACCPRHATRAVFNFVGPVAELFALVKNKALRIRQVERAARRNVAKILQFGYVRAKRRSAPLYKRLWLLYQNRGARTAENELIAGMWLAFVRVETLMREWEEDKSIMQFRMGYRRSGEFFEKELLSDETAIRSLQLDLLRSAIENVAVRTDSRVIALATCASAVSAVVGGLIGSSGFFGS